MSDISQKITHHWITTDGVCKVCFGKIPKGHSVGCYVFVEEQKTKRLERELAAASRSVKELEEVLNQIANQDYRGNRSVESQIAYAALKKGTKP